MRRWIVLVLVASSLLLAGYTVPQWVPWLFSLLGLLEANSELIQSIGAAVQLLLWIGAGVLVAWRVLKPAPPPATTGTPPPTTRTTTVSDRAVSADGGGIAAGVFSIKDATTGDIYIVPPGELWRNLGKSPPAPDFIEATQRYLAYLVTLYRYLNFQGMGIDDRLPLKMPLLDLYVPLKGRVELPTGETHARDVTLAGRPPSREEIEAMGERLSRPLPLLDLLATHDGLILLGDPGSGKTTFLRFLALALATNQAEQVGIAHHRFPILLPLAAYADALVHRPALPLHTFLAQYYLAQVGDRLPIAEMFEAALTQGGALVLLDGLDEVRDLAQRQTVVQRAMQFYALHRKAGNKFLLTSRIVGYAEVRQRVEGLEECTLTDFDHAEIEAFVAKWTIVAEQQAEGASIHSITRAERERTELLRAVHHNPGVRRLASNPLLLTILAIMKRQGITLPERRVELYDAYVKALVRTWNVARSGGKVAGLDLTQTVRDLAPLALWMQQTAPGRGLVKQTELEQTLVAILRKRGSPHPEQEAERFLRDVRDYTSILLDRGARQYGFIHLTFQEYLAAIAIARSGQTDIEAVTRTLSRHLDEDSWREVILLTIGYMGIIQQAEERASVLVQGVLGSGAGAPGQAAIVMGEAVADAYPGGVTDACKAAVVAALRATLQGTTIPAVQRVAAGNTLAKVGDPRFDPEHWYLPHEPLLGFVEIPAGTFIMGSHAVEDEQPVHPVTLPRYWMARYPVTVAQWQAYCKASNTTPRYADSVQGIATHPVVGVYWEEALHYCTWLTAHLTQLASTALLPTLSAPARSFWQGVQEGSHRVVLPSEAEWERVARYTDGRTYPWGDTLTPEHANYRATQIGTTSPVGAFAHGRSAEGVEELSGNVWEWTRSLYDKYPYRAADGRENAQSDGRRVLRGGAFLDYENVLRGAVRGRNSPDRRDYLIGFRVCVSPFSL